MMNDFTMFKGRMAKLSTSHKTIKKVASDMPGFGAGSTKVIDKSFELYLSLYQAVTGTEDIQDIYKQFSPDFFDLIIVDECHRGSARADSAWREILEYFRSAIQLGMTATPRETKTSQQHRLLRRSGLHLLAAPGHRGRLSGSVQGHPSRD